MVYLSQEQKVQSEDCWKQSKGPKSVDMAWLSLCPLKLSLAIQKANENAEALEDLEVHLKRLKEAMLDPLYGWNEADISSELIERIERLTK